MATVTISLPEAAAEWIEQRVRNGPYSSADDYFDALVHRDRAETEQADAGITDFPPHDDRRYTLEDVRRIVAEARASGPGSRSISAIIVEGDRVAKAGGFFRE